jgi:hypothetical protein
MWQSVNQATDRLQILHGHCSHATIFEDCRNNLFDRVNLPRKYFGKLYEFPSRACHIYSRVKVTRKSFKKFRKEHAKEAGDFISCDMGVFLNPKFHHVKVLFTLWCTLIMPVNILGYTV